MLSESESHSVMYNSLRPHRYTVHGILQARTLECTAFPFSRGSSQPRNWTRVSCIAGGFFTSWATREALCNISCIHLLCIFTLLYMWVPPSKALVCLFTSATSTTFQHILIVTLRFCWINEKRAFAFLLLIFLRQVKKEQLELDMEQWTGSK